MVVEPCSIETTAVQRESGMVRCDAGETRVTSPGDPYERRTQDHQYPQDREDRPSYDNMHRYRPPRYM